jgi:hypothetical protein
VSNADFRIIPELLYRPGTKQYSISKIGSHKGHQYMHHKPESTSHYNTTSPLLALKIISSQVIYSRNEETDHTYRMVKKPDRL